MRNDDETTDDLSQDFLDWLIIDILREAKEAERRETRDAECERIFDPGWLDDMRKTIEELEERDRQTAIDRIN